jgi:hypothetical protein
MIRTTQRFFDALFVNRDHEAAFRFFASSAYACLSVGLLPQQRSASDGGSAAEPVVRNNSIAELMRR